MLKIEWKNKRGEHAAQGDQVIIRDPNGNIIGIFIDFGGGYVMFAHAGDKDFHRVLREAGIQEQPKINRYRTSEKGIIVPD